MKELGKYILATLIFILIPFGALIMLISFLIRKIFEAIEGIKRDVIDQE